MTENATTTDARVIEHAHEEWESRDCDGLYSGSSIFIPTHEEQTSEFGDIRFRERVVADVVNSYSLIEGATGTLKITSESMEWDEPTDEGHRSKHVWWCTDPSCDLNAWSRRDHQAEAAGY